MTLTSISPGVDLHQDEYRDEAGEDHEEHGLHLTGQKDNILTITIKKLQSTL